MHFDRLVLVVARTVTALNRLLDVVSLLREDHRIQVVFTADPEGSAVFRRGVQQLLEVLDVFVIDWQDAVTVEFDLILTASENDRLPLLHGPILLVSHGFGHQKYYPKSRTIAGLNPDRLVHDNRVLPAAIGVSHPAHLAELARRCPAAAERAAVIGDPALDRMLASRHRVRTYRHAFDAADRPIVLLAATWGPDSLLGRWPELPGQVARELPVDEYRLLTVLHPGVWAAHSRWQLQGWLARAQEAGVELVDPQFWQAALLASSAVLSDQGSLALYAAALGKPLSLIPGDARHTVSGSPLAELAATTNRLDRRGELAEQLEKLLATPVPGPHRRIVERACHPIGGSASTLRRVLYRLLCLSEHDPPATYPAAPCPPKQPQSWSALVVSAEETDGVLRIRRVPALRRGCPLDGLEFRHLITELDTAASAEVGAASILVCGGETTPHTFAETAHTMLAEWPDAQLLVTRYQGGQCLVGFRGGVLTASIDDPPIRFDPTILGSVVYVWSCQGRSITGSGRLLVGDRVFTIRVVASRVS